MQRVRAGLTGLGLVFLVVLAASILFAPVRPVPSARTAGEPLAMLGVAPHTRTATPAIDPGAAPQNELQNAPQPAQKHPVSQQRETLPAAPALTDI
jgi:hypothetical protein